MLVMSKCICSVSAAVVLPKVHALFIYSHSDYNIFRGFFVYHCFSVGNGFGNVQRIFKDI